MFYVYDLDGLRFKGPVEQLERERKVTRRAPVPSVKRGRRTTLFSETQGVPAPDNPAVAAYLRTMNRANMVEPLVHIYQIMSSPVVTVASDISLIEAWGMLDQNGIRQLVVITERNRVVGMLGDRDILKRINVIDDKVDMNRDLTVADVMQRDVITTDSISDIRRVARVMAYYRIDSLPVTRDDGDLAGIITRGDILRGFAKNPRLNLWA